MSFYRDFFRVMRKIKPQCPEDNGINRNLNYIESSGGLLLNATSIITGMLAPIIVINIYIIFIKQAI